MSTTSPRVLMPFCKFSSKIQTAERRVSGSPYLCLSVSFPSCLSCVSRRARVEEFICVCENALSSQVALPS